MNVTIKGGYVTISKTTSDGFSTTLRGNQGTIQQLNDQVFVIVAVDGRRAVLRMSKK
ncbi:hypothetical protein [Actinoplanes sp. NBRC 103695]|uniref:hypothetical protein n=1 Tax=Actinoplanes sp. NBRC 103695 TaxID=3032202 RepID=UPI0024A35292|nr:hypothetical protein [Actinoplanes sp. NBRC 103695]GLY99378.1 hypothetical protein Acsp02_66310 [Actinoplanes sp. NBRC 103695]